MPNPVREKDFVRDFGDRPLKISELENGSRLKQAAEAVDDGDGVIQGDEIGRVFRRYESMIERNDGDTVLEHENFVRLAEQWRQATPDRPEVAQIGVRATSATAESMDGEFSQGFFGRLWDWIRELFGDPVTLLRDRDEYIEERAVEAYNADGFPQEEVQTFLTTDELTEAERVDMMAEQIRRRDPDAYAGPDGVDKSKADAKAALAGLRRAAGLQAPTRSEPADSRDGADATDSTEGGRQTADSGDGADATDPTKKGRRTDGASRASGAEQTRHRETVDMLVANDPNVVRIRAELETLEGDPSTTDDVLAQKKRTLAEAERTARAAIEGEIVELSVARQRVVFAKAKVDAINDQIVAYEGGDAGRRRLEAKREAALADLKQAKARETAAERALQTRFNRATDNPRAFDISDLETSEMSADADEVAEPLDADDYSVPELTVQSPSVQRAIGRVVDTTPVTGSERERDDQRQQIGRAINDTLNQDLSHLSEDEIATKVQTDVKAATGHELSRQDALAIARAYVARRAEVTKVLDEVRADRPDADREAELVDEKQRLEGLDTTPAREQRLAEIRSELLEIRARRAERAASVRRLLAVIAPAVEEDAR